MSRLTYKWVNDEKAEIFVDDAYVGYMDHGAHSWDGMEGIQNTLNSVARLLGWQIEVQGEPAI